MISLMQQICHVIFYKKVFIRMTFLIIALIVITFNNESLQLTQNEQYHYWTISLKCDLNIPDVMFVMYV